MKKISVLLVLLFAFACSSFARGSFVKVRNGQFLIDEKPYYFIGTNYWYGSFLGLVKDKRRGVKRLRKELDFLKRNGVTNLRVAAGAEGSGMINGVTRIGPALQPSQGVFNEEVLDGLDLLLYEMGKRKMKAVIFFSNNWEWSGGFQQYLNWNGLVPDDMKTRRLTWNELRDTVSKFYSCDPCKKAYNKQVEYVMNRTNKISKTKYIDDPTIMAWELGNEPRPMRPRANADYKTWVADVAAFIKAKDKKHLVVIGHEGRIGTESMELFEEIHADKNIDYLTIHIWAKNWNWFREGKMAEDFPKAMVKVENYIAEHLLIAKKLNKPIVLEEFGLPRDGQSFDVKSSTSFRDRYYGEILARLAEHSKSGGHFAGTNFWAFGGIARPIKGQLFWKKGDDYMGDPPMEEQGLNSVFDSDKNTWRVIKWHFELMKK